MTFKLIDSQEVQDFFDKYQSFENLSDVDIEEFPVEKLFIESIDIYKKIINEEFQLDIEDIPFLGTDEEMKDKVSESLANTYITIFEKELNYLENIKDFELKNFKNKYIRDILEVKLKECIKVEDYEQAAVLRDEIKELQS